MEIIDAYLHCGLTKFKPVEDVRRVMDAAGVSRAVIVQHLGEFDNAYIGGIIRDDPARFAGVGLVDHSAPDWPDALARLAGAGFKGLRLTADTLTGAPGVWRAAADAGLILVVYAPQGVAGALGPMREFLEDRPHCSLVLTHLGNPAIGAAPEFTNDKQVMALARYPGVRYQISGMAMFCPYPHAELHPLVRAAFDRFGAARLLWGSNYPVVGGEPDYRRDLGLVLDGKLPVPADVIPAVAGGNALKLWFASGGQSAAERT